MWQSRLSHKSMADYDYHQVIKQKKNLAQVQKVLTIYQNNNQSLVDQVYSLIKQNEQLRKQAKQPKLQKARLQPFKPQYSISQMNENSQINTTVRSTTKKHNTTIKNSKIRLNHPRDVYLPAQQAHMMNMKRLKQAKTVHKAYDQTREFEQFKEKLSAKKQQLKKSYKRKYVIENSDLSLSRKVYIDRPQVETLEFHERKSTVQQHKSTVQLEKVHPLTIRIDTSPKFQKRDNSPYGDFNKQTTYHSPNKGTGRSYNEPLKSAQRSSSAIKIQQVYPENSIKIAEPKTKWSDLSSTYFERSKWMQNDQNGLLSSNQFYDAMGQSKQGKSKRKKFLNVVSQSVLEDKLNQRKQF